jgi:hypothetical protein
LVDQANKLVLGGAVDAKGSANALLVAEISRNFPATTARMWGGSGATGLSASPPHQPGARITLLKLSLGRRMAASGQRQPRGARSMRRS